MRSQFFMRTLTMPDARRNSTPVMSKAMAWLMANGQRGSGHISYALSP